MSLFHVIKYPFPWKAAIQMTVNETPAIILNEFSLYSLDLWEQGVIDIEEYRKEYTRLLLKYED